MRELESEQPKTTDIGYCAAVVLNGGTLEAIRPIDNRRSAFVFSKKDQELLKRLEPLYWRDELLVPAHRYHQELKIVKSRLYGQQGL